MGRNSLPPPDDGNQRAIEPYRQVPPLGKQINVSPNRGLHGTIHINIPGAQSSGNQWAGDVGFEDEFDYEEEDPGQPPVGSSKRRPISSMPPRRARRKSSRFSLKSIIIGATLVLLIIVLLFGFVSIKRIINGSSNQSSITQSVCITSQPSSMKPVEISDRSIGAIHVPQNEQVLVLGLDSQNNVMLTFSAYGEKVYNPHTEDKMAYVASVWVVPQGQDFVRGADYMLTVNRISNLVPFKNALKDYERQFHVSGC